MTTTIKNTISIIAPLKSECQVNKFKKMRKIRQKNILWSDFRQVKV